MSRIKYKEEDAKKYVCPFNAGLNVTCVGKDCLAWYSENSNIGYCLLIKTPREETYGFSGRVNRAKSLL